MDKQKVQLRIAVIGMVVSIFTGLTTVTVKVIDLVMSKDEPVAMTTNAAGTNSAGTNAAADPKMAVTPNAPLAPAPNTIAFPIWAVVLILSGLVTVACLLAWSKIRRKLLESQTA